MRRSVRDAIVGFSVIGAFVGLHNDGLDARMRLGASEWTLTARFADASGLAERSPVTYRGILVGSVRRIRRSDAVVADLEILKAISGCRCPSRRLWPQVRFSG